MAALGAAIKMRDNQSLMRDCGTVILFAGQSRGMWDGWQVCNRRVTVVVLSVCQQLFSHYRLRGGL